MSERDTPKAEGEPDDRFDENAVVEIPIDGTLDLHAFRPGEMSEIVREYLRAAAEEGLDEVRIVHGKGKGVLRHGVIKLLEKLPIVESFQSGGSGRGEWGATIVHLKRRRDENP